MKKCFKCNIEKDLDCFYKHKKMADGYLNKCKDCSRKYAHSYKQEKAETIRKYDRNRADLPHRVAARQAYQKTEAYKDAMKRASAKWKEKNPLKREAYKTVNNFVRSGLIKKENCCICGDSKTYAHHPDYRERTKIEWYCKKCRNPNPKRKK